MKQKAIKLLILIVISVTFLIGVSQAQSNTAEISLVFTDETMTIVVESSISFNIADMSFKYVGLRTDSSNAGTVVTRLESRNLTQLPFTLPDGQDLVWDEPLESGVLCLHIHVVDTDVPPPLDCTEDLTYRAEVQNRDLFWWNAHRVQTRALIINRYAGAEDPELIGNCSGGGRSDNGFAPCYFDYEVRIAIAATVAEEIDNGEAMLRENANKMIDGESELDIDTIVDELAPELIDIGESTLAIDLLTKGLNEEDSGREGELYRLRGEAFLADIESDSDYDRAIHDFEEFAAVSRRDPTPYYLLGQVYLERRLFDDAVTSYMSALEINDRQPETWYQLAIAQRSLGEFDEAISSLGEAIDLDATYFDALSLLAFVYYDNEDYHQCVLAHDAAIEIAEDVFGYIPSYLFNNKGVCYSRRSLHSQAIPLYEDAIQADSSSVIAIRNLGYTYADVGRYEDAIDVFNDLRDELDTQYLEAVGDEENPDILPDNSGYIGLGYVYLRHGQDILNTSRETLRRMELTEDDEQYITLNDRAIRRASTRFVMAEDWFLQAIQKNPEIDSNNFNAYTLLASVYIGQGDFGRAVEIIEQGLALPDISSDTQTSLYIEYSDVLVSEAFNELSNDDIEEMNEVFEQAIDILRSALEEVEEITPSQEASIYIALSNIYMSRGNPEMAIIEVNNGLALSGLTNREIAHLYYRLSDIYRRQDDVIAQIDALDNAILRSPQEA